VTNYAEKMALGTMDRSRQYLAFGIYILAEALLFVPLLYLAIYLTEDFSLISQAGLVTLALFSGLTAVALTMEADFNFLKAGLTIGFFVAIGLIVAGMLFGFSLGLWFSVGMVVLAAGSILYQTSNIRYRYQKEQYVAASLGLFASLMLLFWYILDIFMRSE
jgi:FtsH-binding integral membrane protein